MNFKTQLFYFLKPIFWGIIIALVVLYGANFVNVVGKFFDNNQVASYSDAVKKASPAVVNIYSQQYIDSGIDNKQHLQPTGLGSGIIVDNKGYILTNFHVVSQADQILIALQDGRLFSAKVVGSDLITDLAVLQIEGNNLPVIPQNPSYIPQVGDIVLAIGNPYNLGQTITQGIISATGRNGMSSSGRQDFLQTDAAINEGNSGGALINSRGELVGINTSEFYTNSQNISNGISFAIPYQLSQRIMESLIRDGRVIRGSLGLVAENLDPLLARLWGLKSQNSIIIKAVNENGPAFNAGVEVNDILLKINGKSVENLVTAMDSVAELKPGSETTLTLLRKGKELQLPVIIGELTTPQFKAETSKQN
ncbi:outer membrane-stress sensor serine endopeptidase DegS [Psychromonas sp. psych-6C06]|uniref:outer membrane-stress sensor serine endopeptidase DegS n=1 Tax=Psychromonas sp. psych-6C06 TaxID=2058089 RepID=UPI000C321A41|nr:outer membrane-stress sensor serine endopeptidase DegS [Psychromonas sp. psych-6C06]PKF60470.1 outer membrane-stress sensor serine endopeptidase DegS [Psychromonas sp. psych-6C06]